LVDEEEIIRVAKLMKIDLVDQAQSDEEAESATGDIEFKINPNVLRVANTPYNRETLDLTTVGGRENVNRVKKMLEYFDILDHIDLSSEEIVSQEKTLDELRKDEFIPYDKKLIESLKNFREHYVRAPKMN